MLKKYFLTLAAVCLPHLILTQAHNLLVKESYPNAYQWYLDMSEKYPDAKLSSIQFCICDHHHAKKNSLYFPQSSLEFINAWYKSSQATTQVAHKLALEEYLLLHEAYHALNSDYEKGEFLKKIAVMAGTLAQLNLLAKTCLDPEKIKANILTGVSSAAILASAVISYAQHQENNADQFANQTSDQKALEAGINWHQENKNELNIPQDASAIEQHIKEQLADLAHPTPTKRQKQAKKSYHQRFSSQK